MASEVVSQSARNAAIRLLEAGGQDWQAKEIRIGDGDNFPIVQAFASFEAAIRADQVERDVEVAEERRDEWDYAIANGLRRVAVSKQYADGAAIEAEIIAAAIRQKGSEHAG